MSGAHKKKNFDAQLAIRMTQETRDKLQARADKEERTMCQMGRIIIERALLKQKL